MATERSNHISPITSKIAATEKLYSQAELGASADAVLRALDPLIERRSGFSSTNLLSARPSLAHYSITEQELARSGG